MEVLKSSDSVEIEPIGFLRKKNGKIILIPAGSFGVPDHFFGLKPVSELNNQVYLPVEEEIPVTKLSEDIAEEEEYEEINKTRSWVILFISFIAFLIAISALYYLNSDFNSFIKNKSAGIFSSTNKVEQAAPELIDSTKISSDKLNNVVDSASIVSDSLQQQTDTTIAGGNVSDILCPIEVVNYELIIAAFSIKTEADMYIKQIGTKGIQAKIVENMPGKKLKISIGTFLDEESAQKELSRIHKNINKDAWIARVKQSKNPK